MVSNKQRGQSVRRRKGRIGIALLPCYLGDTDPHLVRALPDLVPELTNELWIVTHADLKKIARVRAFFDLVGESLTHEHKLFEGEQWFRAENRKKFPETERSEVT